MAIFFLPSIYRRFTVDLPAGNLVACGGIDLATGQAFTGTLTAPSGAVVITPVTTVVQQMLAKDPGLSPAEVEGIIFTAWALRRSISHLMIRC